MKQANDSSLKTNTCLSKRRLDKLNYKMNSWAQVRRDTSFESHNLIRSNWEGHKRVSYALMSEEGLDDEVSQLIVRLAQHRNILIDDMHDGF